MVLITTTTTTTVARRTADRLVCQVRSIAIAGASGSHGGSLADEPKPLARSSAHGFGPFRWRSALFVAFNATSQGRVGSTRCLAFLFLPFSPYPFFPVSCIILPCMSPLQQRTIEIPDKIVYFFVLIKGLTTINIVHLILFTYSRGRSLSDNTQEKKNKSFTR